MATILYAEDEVFLGKIVKETLESRGYAVRMETDGRDVTEAFHQLKPDICILDIMLPEMSGFELLKAARRAGSATPVIFLTARDEKSDVVHGLELGADDYLIKPFSFPELLARVRAVLRRGQKESESSRLTLADLTLNLISRTAERAGQVIELSGKEFALLEYMMRNAGQILTRTMILEHVWGYDFDTSSNIIDVHINRLRGKIDFDAAVKLIKTIKGVGYVLKAED